MVSAISSRYNISIWFRVLLSFTGLFVTTGISFAEQVRDFANEAYSNVRLIKVENDLVGWRVQIIRTASLAYVLVQSFEGAPQPPCLAPADLRVNGVIQFELPASCAVQGRFSGKIHGKAIVGNFSNGMTGPNGETTMTLLRIH